MQELWFLRSAHRPMLVNIFMKFHEDILKGRDDFVTDRQTDDPGKNNMSLNPKGG